MKRQRWCEQRTGRAVREHPEVFQHPRFHMHFTPTYSSWLNLVERWFASLTDEALRRGSHQSTRELRDAIERYIGATNDEPTPFVWTKTADEIIAAVSRFCARTLAQADS
jgi:transposase